MSANVPNTNINRSMQVKKFKQMLVFLFLVDSYLLRSYFHVNFCGSGFYFQTVLRGLDLLYWLKILLLRIFM